MSSSSKTASRRRESRKREREMASRRAMKIESMSPKGNDHREG